MANGLHFPKNGKNKVGGIFGGEQKNLLQQLITQKLIISADTV